MKWYSVNIERGKKGNVFRVVIDGGKHSMKSVEFVCACCGSVLRGVMNLKKGVGEIVLPNCNIDKLCGSFFTDENGSVVYIGECVSDANELLNEFVKTYKVIQSGGEFDLNVLHRLNIITVTLLSNSTKFDVDNNLLPVLRFMINLKELPLIQELGLFVNVIDDKLKKAGVIDYFVVGHYLIVRFSDRIVIFDTVSDKLLDEFVSVLLYCLNGVIDNRGNYGHTPEVEVTLDTPSSPEEFILLTEKLKKELF